MGGFINLLGFKSMDVAGPLITTVGVTIIKCVVVIIITVVANAVIATAM
jgi:hypothetical protein